MASFGSRLKKLREERDISQQALADVFYTSQQSIQAYEVNRQLPDIEMVKQLASYFGVSVDYLIGVVNVRAPITKARPYKLSNEEEKLIVKFRDVSDKMQESLITITDSICELPNSHD